MADCAAIPSCAHVLPRRRSLSDTSLFIPQNVRIRTLQRECILFGNTYLSHQHPSLQVRVVTSPLNRSTLRCCCLGALVNPENLVPASWASYVDEALLVVSVVFAYLAGAIPHKGAIPAARSDIADKDYAASSSIPSGRSLENDMDSKTNDFWGEVKGKLLDALSADEHGHSLNGKAVESEVHIKTSPLSLFSLAEGPRFRLLSATLQQLQKEVSDISLRHEVVKRDAWLAVALEVMKGPIQPACSKWLEEELILEIGNSDMKPINRIFEKLKGDDTIIQNIGRSGKLELYADLLFFLRFSCVRSACFYESKFLSLNGVNILEDLVIMLADGIAGIYLELISVDSSISSEINAMGLTLCSLSTRELQRLRNEVALNQWLLENFESVVSMYEDRFELNVLCQKKHESPPESTREESIWWKRLTFRKLKTEPSLSYILINPISLPVKRTKELRALSGWRYSFSLFLEFTDITMPLVKIVVTKVCSAVSFFLVYMIGRSLGLIFSGIRQSLGWQ